LDLGINPNILKGVTMAKVPFIFGVIGLTVLSFSLIMIFYILNKTSDFTDSVNIKIMFFSLLSFISIIISVLAIVIGQIELKKETDNKKRKIIKSGIILGMTGFSFITFPMIMYIFFIPLIIFMFLGKNNIYLSYILIIFSFIITSVLHIYFFRRIIKKLNKTQPPDVADG